MSESRRYIRRFTTNRRPFRIFFQTHYYYFSPFFEACERARGLVQKGLKYLSSVGAGPSRTQNPFNWNLKRGQYLIYITTRHMHSFARPFFKCDRKTDFCDISSFFENFNYMIHWILFVNVYFWAILSAGLNLHPCYPLLPPPPWFCGGHHPSSPVRNDPDQLSINPNPRKSQPSRTHIPKIWANR